MAVNRSAWLWALILLQLCGCSSKQKELNQLKRENAELRSMLAATDSAALELTLAFEEVVGTLNEVTTRQLGVIRFANSAEAPSVASNDLEDALEKIKRIEEALVQARTREAELLERLARSVQDGANAAAYTIRIKQLGSTLTRKEAEIATLKKGLLDLQSEKRALEAFNKTLRRENTDLTREKDDLSKTLVEKIESNRNLARETKKLEAEVQALESRVFMGMYMVATKSDLKKHVKNKVLTRAKKHLYEPGSRFSEAFFHTVNIKPGTVVLSGVESAQVISSHASQPQLYSLIRTRDGTVMRITDPEKFWNHSKYLIFRQEK